MPSTALSRKSTHRLSRNIPICIRFTSSHDGQRCAVERFLDIVVDRKVFADRGFQGSPVKIATEQG
ncbi:MAG TPA: hypothetical protein VFZ12_04985 [Dehalococcoidia bacterium]|nr:hypothetical protein [Dehalococcoidia bacterium]